MHFSTLLAVAAAATVEAANQGFNYGATNSDGSIKVQQDFENEFNRAKNLPGTSGFTSARLYTMVQGGTANTVSSAIPAAIASNTGLLLGLWASAGQASFDNEVTALKNAIQQYGTSFTNLIEGISVGSEDLYRNSPTGIINKSGYGAQPQDLVNYISQVRAAIAGTAAAGKSIGHVDTWTSWVNGSNAAVINAVDWLGVDGYPYFQNTQSNGIENGASLFFDSYNATVGAAGGKDVWITETGWPVSGPTENLAVASTENAEKYWQDVACRVLGNINTYWYTLQDAYPVTPAPSFGLIGTDLNSAPLYDLTCKASTSSSSSSSVASSSMAVSTAVSTSVASPTQPSTAAATSTVSIATQPGQESTASVSSSSAASTTAIQSTSSVPELTTGTAPIVVTSTAITSVRGTTSAQGTAPVSGTSSVATPSASVQPSTGGAGSPHTFTSYTTTLVTVTACPGTCSGASATGSTTVVAPSPSSSSCPANLAGAYEFPHLIIPVDSANPNKASGTSYSGLITPSISSIFNFDIPASDAGKTCTLVFLFPQKEQLETSNYQFNGKGGLLITGLSSPVTEATTFASVPSANGQTGSIADLQPGNSYTVLSQACPAGQRISYEFSSVGGLELNYFQDYNPSPLGVYITVC